MPTIPDEVERDDTVRQQIVAATRRAGNTVVPKEVGLRAWVALIVALLVCVTNPIIPLALAGGLACVYLAVDLTRTRR